MLGGRCQEHTLENKQKELAMFKPGWRRSGRATRFLSPSICSDEKGTVDLFSRVSPKYRTTKGQEIQADRVQLDPKEESLKVVFLQDQ